jgi:hypothetical protein
MSQASNQTEQTELKPKTDPQSEIQQIEAQIQALLKQKEQLLQQQNVNRIPQDNSVVCHNNPFPKILP